MRRAIIIMLFIAAAFYMTGAEKPERPVTVSYMAGAGTAHITDAYLSPFPTSGWGTALMYERSQALRSRPELWSGLLVASLDLSRGHTSGTLNGTMWGASLDLQLAALRRFELPFSALRLAAGPQIELLAGANYRPANGNNPVGAQIALTAGIAARAAMTIKLGSLPVDFSFRPSVQLTGMFLAPQYGQLYYEIYEGDSKGIARFAWPGNRLAYSHLLAADLRFGATALRLGYSLRMLTQEASHLAVNTATHLFVLGITTNFSTINLRHPRPAHQPVIFSF